MVSIFMLVYNQKVYVEQAIKGVLAQETSFQYLLVIGEDFSTDGTREICIHYAEKFPDKIKLLLNEENLGLGPNYVKTYKECHGKYVAICDGDDYWTDPLKLKKQVEFLELNPQYNIIHTNKFDLFPSGKLEIGNVHLIQSTTEFKNLVFENYIASVTVMFRNKRLSPEMEKWFSFLPYCDWPTYLWILNEGGKIYFLNAVTAVYRKDFGSSTRLREKKSKMGEINLAILMHLRDELIRPNRKNLIIESIYKHKIGLMASYNKEHRFIKSLRELSALCKVKNPFKMTRIYLYSLKRAFQVLLVKSL